jgi:hypothetical protein
LVTFKAKEDSPFEKFNKNSKDENIVKAVLLAGLYPNLYQVNESSLSNKEVTYINGKETALLHNTSVNSLLPQTKLALLVITIM